MELRLALRYEDEFTRTFNMSNIQNMNIAGQPIGTNYKPYIIAEMSANHNGSIDRAFKIIDEAKKAGADAAWMLDVNGFVNTTNACNFFIVRKEQVWTSTGDYCMNGITRQKVIDLCKENNIEVYEKNFSLSETYSAEEAFLTGTFGAQTPVGEIDGRIIGDGTMGPITSFLRQAYKDLIKKVTN